MHLVKTKIPEIILIEPNVYTDDRGWFMESFNSELFYNQLRQLNLPLPPPFVQDNLSFSKKNVLRGLHYQLPPHAQGKLVRVIQGRAFDVAVDLRETSLTFGQWVGFELSAANHRMMWIPEGFAHGFVALEDNTQFFYKTTDFYHKTSEASVRWNDPSLAIDWPITSPPVINEKDEAAPSFQDAIKFSKPLYPGSIKQIELNVLGDARGSLVALEQGNGIPFPLKRAYYIFANKMNISRGFHAHKKLKQVAICVSGKCRLILDNGQTREEVWLDSPTKGLIISNMIWREMYDFSHDCVLLVLASENYDENDYIRDYSQFKKETVIL